MLLSAENRNFLEKLTAMRAQLDGKENQGFVYATQS
jgi:hypothetical protein